MAEERKVEFAGSGIIKKCPNCGQQLDVFQAKCPACGFAISGVDKGGTSSVQTFLEQYLGESDNARKLDMINTFPIPNTIEDTIEFAIMAVQQVKSYAMSQKETGYANNMSGLGLKDIFASTVNGITAGKMVTSTDFRIAWKNKLDQVCQRAKIAYPQDRASLQHLDMLVKDAENAVNALEKGRKKSRTIIFASIIGISVLIYGILLPIMDRSEKKQGETSRLEKMTAEIQTDIAEGNYDAAELRLLDFRWTYDKDESQISIWEEKKALLVKQLESKKKAGE